MRWSQPPAPTEKLCGGVSHIAVLSVPLCAQVGWFVPMGHPTRGLYCFLTMCTSKWMVCAGLGRIVALHHRSSTSYQIH
jgi:hypothetical protein